MATNNTNSFASTNNNSKEENVMKANTSTFAQDCTHPYTFAKIFYDIIALGNTQLAPSESAFFMGEDYYNHRMALYVATGDTDPDPDDEVNFENICRHYYMSDVALIDDADVDIACDIKARRAAHKYDLMCHMHNICDTYGLNEAGREDIWSLITEAPIDIMAITTDLVDRLIDDYIDR